MRKGVAHATPDSSKTAPTAKNPYGKSGKPVLFCLERETRFELATFALARQRSTTEPLPRTSTFIIIICNNQGLLLYDNKLLRKKQLFL